MKTTLTEMLTSKKFIATLVAIAVCVGDKLGLDLDPALLEKIYIALLVFVGAMGVADAGKSAAQIRAVSDHSSGRVELQAAINRMASRIPTSLLAAFGVAALLQASCASGAPKARPTLTAGLGAFLDCESAHIDDDALADARTFADGKVKEWTAAGARPSSAAIRDLLSRIRSDLGRCAIAGAVAAATAAWKTRSTWKVAGDPDLRETFVEAARSLGWGPVKLQDGTTLGEPAAPATK